ncbi:AMP-binding protein [Nostoc sp. C117]|uniref:AMP-binding protein n=1 Tax=Nostoc sp. C117 TaxID=3349875 RepID=UPI00370D79A1
MIFRSSYADIFIPDRPLTEFVLDRAVELADKPAFIEGLTNRTVSYGQLASSIAKVASNLAARGFSKGDVLAIYSPNLPEYAIAFYAVATLGGITTTVNPSYTTQELAYQLNDAGAKYLLTIPELLEQALEAVAQSKIEEVFVFGEANGATSFSLLLEGEAKVPSIQFTPEADLVGLFYSSGTTGLPKGVMYTHQTFLANFHQFQHCEPMSEADTLIGVLPFFHAYGMNMLNYSLACGATIVTMPHFELEIFLNLMEKHKITRIYVAPPIVLALATQPIVDKYNLSSLRAITSGAAPLNPNLIQQCQKRFSNCVVKEVYGSTETLMCMGSLDERDKIKPGSVGQCIRNIECQIIDVDTGQSLNYNQLGELWIRGSQLMKGYWNNPEATANAIDSEGWFHTGDIAYIDEDGYFYIVDRIKDLIKCNGYSIAPAELEAVLLSHPAIADACVIPVEHASSGQIPKAFVVLKDKSKATPEEIIEFTVAKVAPYKRIRQLEFIEQIPKSPAGKILRRLLIHQELKKIRDESEAIMNPTEFRQKLEAAGSASDVRSVVMAHVQSLIIQVLGLDSSLIISPQQGLVNLGMDSVMAIQLKSHLENSFKCLLPSTLAFVYPTVETLVDFLISEPLLAKATCDSANVVTFIPQASSWHPFQYREFNSLSSMTTLPSNIHIPLSQIQRCLWDRMQLRPDTNAYHVNFAVNFTGSLCLKTLEQSFNEVLHRHEILRTTFTILDGQPVQVITPFQLLPLKIVDLQNLSLTKRDAEAEKIMISLFQEPFNLTNSLLIKVICLRIAPQEHRLLISMHHLISDGLSVGIFYRELRKIYQALTTNKFIDAETILPKLQFQHQDFVSWEQQFLQERLQEPQQDYWQKKLIDAHPTVLPPDYSQQSGDYNLAADFYSLVLPDDLLTSIKHLSERQGVTVFVILLATLKISLFKWTGQTDILLAGLHNSRNKIELEKMIGCIFTQVYWRSKISETQTGLMFLNQVQQTLVEALANQDILLFSNLPVIKQDWAKDIPPMINISNVYAHNLPTKWNEELECQILDAMSAFNEMWTNFENIQLFYLSYPTEYYEKLMIKIFFNVSVYKKETIEQFINSYQEILHNFVHQPDMKVLDIIKLV